MRIRNEAYQEGPKDAFSVSISDLMSGLLAIFILALAYFILNFSQATSQLTQNDALRAELLDDIQEQLSSDGIQVTVDEKHGILRISEGVLFDVGRADVKPQGQAVIGKLSGILSQTLQSEPYEGAVETIFIEGHTDNTPINNGVFPSNWELSTKRAINTWRLMAKTHPELDRLQNKNEQPMFSCSGYAETRPIADNQTADGKRANRRIDIRFTMAPPTEEDMSIVRFVRGKLASHE